MQVDNINEPANALRIEASKSDPSSDRDRRGNLVVTHITHSRREAEQEALFLLQRGYWVEIFSDTSGELLAGPFDPDARLPKAIFF